MNVAQLITKLGQYPFDREVVVYSNTQLHDKAIGESSMDHIHTGAYVGPEGTDWDRQVVRIMEVE